VNHDLTPHAERRHGYVFEVDARAEELVEPVPILGMGRFYHEAVCVDPKTAFVYLSEDRDDGLLYRYRPDVVVAEFKSPIELGPGDLAKGGVLEALRIVDRPSARTQNWQNPEPLSGESPARKPATQVFSDSTTAARADSLQTICEQRAFEESKPYTPIPETEHVPIGQRYNGFAFPTWTPTWTWSDIPRTRSGFAAAHRLTARQGQGVARCTIPSPRPARRARKVTAWLPPSSPAAKASISMRAIAPSICRAPTAARRERVSCGDWTWTATS
jgi:hypothetical protein